MSISPQLRPRKFDLAVMLARIAAVTCFCMFVIALLRRSSSFRDETDGERVLRVLLFLVVFYVGPGVTYLVLAPRIKAGRGSAMVTILVIASLQLLITLLAIVGQLLIVGPGFDLGVPVVFALVLVLLVVQVCLCLAAREQLIQGPRGFEPLVPHARPGPPSAPERAGSDGPDTR